MRKISACLLLFLCGFGFATKTIAQEATIDISDGDTKVKISRNIYGHFAEHLGRCIYDGFYVGESSKIPNTNGVRKDIINALKKMKIPVLRWPGGCFADTYHWKDGIGPKDKRPSMVNRWWGGVTENNSFGLHDFLNMCELLGAEPYLAGNIATGTVQEFADFVLYTNTNAKNPMSEWRKQNGRDKPWNVKYWGVGNEAWGCGGNMTPEYYVNEFKKYSTFMTDWTNSDKIFRVASGANVADYHWTETLMKNIPKNLMEGIALHHYSFVEWDNKGPATGFTEDQYFKTIERALFMDTLVINHSAIMDKYDPQKRIALVVDEWGGWYNVEPNTNPAFLYQQNTMRDAMIAGVTLNIFQKHADRVRMANLAQCVNVLQAVILTDKEKMILTPTYHVMEMYNVHQDASLLDVKISSGNYVFNGKSLQAVSASASKDSLGVIHISLVNIDPSKSQKITINMSGSKPAAVTGRILASKKLQDYNSFDEPEKIKPAAFTGASIENNSISVNMPPASVVVLTVK
jgi:alpha-N-arabinofuranosidase